jgi:hypothetical protein
MQQANIKVTAINSFSGLITMGKGATRTLPLDVARSLERSGLVKIIVEEKPLNDFDTLEGVQKYLEENGIKYNKRIKLVEKLKEKYGL